MGVQCIFIPQEVLDFFKQTSLLKQINLQICGISTYVIISSLDIPIVLTLIVMNIT